MERRYTVSKSIYGDCWYAHKKGYAYIPVAGSLSDKKSEAQEYARMMDGLPNKVEQIEAKRRKEK